MFGKTYVFHQWGAHIGCFAHYLQTGHEQLAGIHVRG